MSRKEYSELTNKKRFLTTLVLAGGKSSRMGTDKALLVLDGVPLLAKICALGRACSHRVCVVTPRIDKYASILPPGCELIREELLPGETEFAGPLVGFAQGLSRVQTEWVLLLACDLPNLDRAELARWLSSLPQVAAGAIALLPKHPKGWEPLSGFYRRSCLPSLEKYIESGGRSFQSWLAMNSVAELSISNPNLIYNCNTPEDWQKIAEM